MPNILPTKMLCQIYGLILESYSRFYNYVIVFIEYINCNFSVMPISINRDFLIYMFQTHSINSETLLQVLGHLE